MAFWAVCIFAGVMVRQSPAGELYLCKLQSSHHLQRFFFLHFTLRKGFDFRASLDDSRMRTGHAHTPKWKIIGWKTFADWFILNVKAAEIEKGEELPARKKTKPIYCFECPSIWGMDWPLLPLTPGLLCSMVQGHGVAATRVNDFFCLLFWLWCSWYCPVWACRAHLKLCEEFGAPPPPPVPIFPSTPCTAPTSLSF